MRGRYVMFAEGGPGHEGTAVIADTGARVSRMSWMKRMLFLLLLGLMPLQSGCVVAAVGIAAAGVTTAKSTMEDVVERSYVQPYWCVYRATHAALHEMSIGVDNVEGVKEGDVFHAKTTEYPVTVELHRITDTVTRVREEAGKNVFQQDQATAMAVADAIHQVIARNLHTGMVVTPES